MDEDQSGATQLAIAHRALKQLPPSAYRPNRRHDDMKPTYRLDSIFRTFALTAPLTSSATSPSPRAPMMATAFTWELYT